VKKFWLIALMAFGMVSCSPSEEELLQAAMEKMDEGSWVEAGEYFDRILDKNPTNAQAFNAKGVSLFQQKNTKKQFLCSLKRSRQIRLATNLGSTEQMQISNWAISKNL
jgi:Flp pilus assembly protein TadD